VPTRTLTLWVYDESRIEVRNQIGQQLAVDIGIAVDVALLEPGDSRTQMALAAVPTLLLFYSSQKYIIAGLTSGSVRQ
jgi:ABC-type glycerol-3-phosphate transport system permease component